MTDGWDTYEVILVIRKSMVTTDLKDRNLVVPVYAPDQISAVGLAVAENMFDMRCWKLVRVKGVRCMDD